MRAPLKIVLRAHCPHGYVFLPDDPYLVKSWAGHVCQVCSTPSPSRQRTRRNDARPPLPVEQRFWAKVEKTDSCWNWTGALNKAGYGVTRGQVTPAAPKGAVRKAPWISYELVHGPVPDGLPLLHACQNRRCVNPAHLVLGMLQDRPAKGRRKEARTHCPQGHEFTAENSYFQQKKRSCRHCTSERTRAFRARKKAGQSG
ncbi:HNH endonuclease [Hymenobacter cellulosilyticus]|uniref:HNH endonuclease n=1 Tax=Hymenobacter cellulosilyticus TaxID=2932248 RepID=UPI0035C9E46D